MVIVESASARVIVLCPTGSGNWIWHISRELNGRYWTGANVEAAEKNQYKGIGGFALYRSDSPSLTLRVPHWFLVLAAIGMGALSWLRPRFSLRTLLIATTLVAVVLGLIVYAVRK